MPINPKTSKAMRVRVVRTILPVIYARLQDALRKRRMAPVEFKLTVSHKNARVKVSPHIEAVMNDREVRDALKRAASLLTQNQT